MAIGVINNESSVGLKIESTESTYEATTSSTDYVEVLSEGTEINKTRETLERDNLNSTLEGEAARVGMTAVDGQFGVELRASTTEGDAPQSLDVLLRSLLGGKRQITSDQTSGSSHTSTVINFADTSAFAVGDLVLIKESGAYEIRPISAITTNTSITLAFALTNGAPSDSVVVAQCTTYYHDAANAPSFSCEHNIGNEIQQRAAGLRATSGTIENWTVGNIPTMSFSVQGTSLERADDTQTATPDFTADALPPVALEACLFINGTNYAYTELGLAIENEVGFIQSACSESGKIGSRLTSQGVTFTANPYMDDTSLTTWDNFNDNDDVSIFFYAFNPSSTAGEFSECVAGWLPQAKITEHPAGDNEGLATNQLSAKAHRSSGNDSVFLGFI